MITAEELRELLNYDPETGVFTWRVRIGARALAGSVAGSSRRDGYLSIKVGGKQHQAHRLAWLWQTGEHPAADVDHIDGDRRNNRIANLRDVSRTINVQNQHRARRDNKSGYLGVSAWAGAFVAQIGIAGKVIKLGSFSTPESAHAAYLSAKRRHHAGCTI